MSTRGGGASGARERAGGPTRRRASGRGGAEPRKIREVGAGDASARAPAAAVSLRVRAAGLSLAVGGDWGREKEKRGWRQRPL